jgi:hypothetical protein
VNGTVEHDDSDLTGWNDRDEEAPSLLEVRYRTVLRLLPASYRADREEEMVDTYLESAVGDSDPDALRPTLAEVASVAGLALRVRLGGVGSAPRFFVWGQAVRLAALLGLLGHAAGSVLGAFYRLRLNGALGAPPDLGIEYDTAFGAPGSPTRIWFSLTTVLVLLWIPAFVLLVLGRRRPAKVFALLAAAPTVAGMLREVVLTVRGSTTLETFWISQLHGLLVMVPLLALLAGFHRDAPVTREARRWLAGMGALGAGTLGVALLAGDNLYSFGWVDGAGLFCLFLIGAGLVYGAMFGTGRERYDPAWPMALVALTLPVLAARLSLLPMLARLDPEDAGAVAAVRAEAAGLAVVGLVLAVLAYLSLRRMPRSTLPSVDR